MFITMIFSLLIKFHNYENIEITIATTFLKKR